MWNQDIQWVKWTGFSSKTKRSTISQWLNFSWWNLWLFTYREKCMNSMTNLFKLSIHTRKTRSTALQKSSTLVFSLYTFVRAVKCPQRTWSAISSITSFSTIVKLVEEAVFLHRFKCTWHHSTDCRKQTGNPAFFFKRSRDLISIWKNGYFY